MNESYKKFLTYFFSSAVIIFFLDIVRGVSANLLSFAGVLGFMTDVIVLTIIIWIANKLLRHKKK
jgi:hypothetical protein